MIMKKSFLVVHEEVYFIAKQRQKRLQHVSNCQPKAVKEKNYKDFFIPPNHRLGKAHKHRQSLSPPFFLSPLVTYSAIKFCPSSNKLNPKAKQD